jgi:hypothetical protein
MIGTARCFLPAAAKPPRRLCLQINSRRHSNTSSARTRNAVGIPIPRAFAGLEIEHQSELGRLLRRQIGGLFTFENPAHNRIPARRYKSVMRAHSSARRPRRIAEGVDRRDRIPRSQRHEPITNAANADYHQSADPWEPQASGRRGAIGIEIELALRFSVSPRAQYTFS